MNDAYDTHRRWEMTERQVLFVARWTDGCLLRERLVLEGLDRSVLDTLMIVPDDGLAPARVWPMVVAWLPDHGEGTLAIFVLQATRRPLGRRRWKLQHKEACRLWRRWSGGEGDPEVREVGVRP